MGHGLSRSADLQRSNVDNVAIVTTWEWIWAWTGDSDFWAWARTLAAALLGVSIGGLFTVWGLARQSKSVSRLQRAQFAAASDAAAAQWEQEQVAAARLVSLVVARELFERFVDLHRGIQREQPSLSEVVRGDSWEQKWEAIWSEEVSLEIDVRARLIVDEETRTAVQVLVVHLDAIVSVTSDAGYPTALPVRLQEAAAQLTAEGIEVMGAYIRGQPHVSDRRSMLEALDQAEKRFEGFQNAVAEAEIAAAEGR